MKIFLTGATGYIGAAVAKALGVARHTVVGIARSVEADQKLRDAGIVSHRADLSHPESLTGVAESCDAVISTGTTNDGRLDEAAVTCMLQQFKGSRKPFLYTSGVWVLGDTGGLVVDETAPLNPIPMVAWRAGVEKLVQGAAAGNIRSAVIRPAIVYGHRRGIPAMFLESAQQSGAPRYVGTGANHWPMVHVEDLADLFVLALAAPAGSLFHAGDGTAFRVKEIAEAASFGAGAGGRTESWPLDDACKTLGPFADALVLDQQVSSEKARRDLGWRPHRPYILDDLRAGSYAAERVSF